MGKKFQGYAKWIESGWWITLNHEVENMWMVAIHGNYFEYLFISIKKIKLLNNYKCNNIHFKTKLIDTL